MKLAPRIGLLAVACVACAITPMSSHGQSLRAPFVLRFVATDVPNSEITHDVAPKGWSAGDSYFSAMSLVNRRAQLGQPTDRFVGVESILVRVTGPRSGTVRGKTSLPGGSLIVRGAFRVGANGSGFRWPVSGGTGRFAGARGILYINDVVSPHSEMHTYTVSLPGA